MKPLLYHVGISGGKDSTAVLLWMIHDSKIDQTKINVAFCDTGNEHEWTYAHIEWINNNLAPVKTLKPDKNFYELAIDRHRFPSVKARFCTQELKIFPTRDHILELEETYTVIAVSGVRNSESDNRALLGEWSDFFESSLGARIWRPIVKWSLEDVFAYHKKHGAPLNPLYAAGATRVGCFPCIMSRKAEIRNIALNFPERIDKIRAAEQEFLTRYGRPSSFFANAKVPERFRTGRFKKKDGQIILVATIDDVVRWSMTGKNAEGSWKDEISPETICNAGFCE